jgi:hypothetical protein
LNDPSLSTVAFASGIRERRPRWASLLRIAIEFALIFGAALLVKELLAATTSATYPNPLWFPVIALALAHGLAAGLVAAIVATALQFSGGLPAALMPEDMYSYIARITAEPVGWTCAALLIGHIRSRQIASSAELQTRLLDSRQHCAAVAELCEHLRQRAEILERQIAATASASNTDLVEAMSGLRLSGWDDFPRRLTHFVALMTGAPEFTVHLLRDNALELAFQPADAHGSAIDTSVAPVDPLFAAVVNERRIVSAARANDDAVLAGRAIMAGPIIEEKGPRRVIGMLSMRGASLADCSEDIERRFELTCHELSGLAARIGLLQRWHGAPATGPNGPDAAPLGRGAHTGAPAKVSVSQHGRHRLTLR